jgi:predicted CopG family antitoxin
MFKTITIKESVFNRLSTHKGKDESFSDLFERLLDNQFSGIEILKKLRGSIDIQIDRNSGDKGN